MNTIKKILNTDFFISMDLLSLLRQLEKRNKQMILNTRGCKLLFIANKWNTWNSRFKNFLQINIMLYTFFYQIIFSEDIDAN